MSDLANRATFLMAQGDLQQALGLAKQAVRERPADWHARCVLGQCLQNSNDIAGALDELMEANRLAPKNTSVLLALGIARQLGREYDGAIAVLREALEVDPNFVPAINSLAMTQKLMGEFEKADHNYVEALQALGRTIVKDWHNAADTQRFGHVESRNNLWIRYACDAAVWLAGQGGMESIGFPTGETAERDAQTGYLDGWYWNDGVDAERRKVRFYCPNFLNTFRVHLARGGTYSLIIGSGYPLH